MKKWGLIILGTLSLLNLSVHAQLLDMIAGSNFNDVICSVNF